MFLKKYLLLLFLAPLLVLSTVSSYYRFVILHDYLVSYENECDPYSQSCYVYCDDDDCLKPFYYSIIERRANELYQLCGNNVTLCGEAYKCQSSNFECKTYFCEDSDNCDLLSESDRPIENE